MKMSLTRCEPKKRKICVASRPRSLSSPDTDREPDCKAVWRYGSILNTWPRISRSIHSLCSARCDVSFVCFGANTAQSIYCAYVHFNSLTVCARQPRTMILWTVLEQGYCYCNWKISIPQCSGLICNINQRNNPNRKWLLLRPDQVLQNIAITNAQVENCFARAHLSLPLWSHSAPIFMANAFARS